MTTTGNFIWYELMTGDTRAAGKFYGAVVGWTVADRADPQAGTQDYHMIVRSDGGFAGGVLNLSPDMQKQGAHPAWLGDLRCGREAEALDHGMHTADVERVGDDRPGRPVQLLPQFLFIDHGHGSTSGSARNGADSSDFSDGWAAISSITLVRRAGEPLSEGSVSSAERRWRTDAI